MPHISKIIQDINIGENLKRIRSSKGLTQSQVCAKLDLIGRPTVQSTYSQIETGKRNIFASDLMALKQIFEVDYDEFFWNLEPKDKYASAVESESL